MSAEPARLLLSTNVARLAATVRQLTECRTLLVTMTRDIEMLEKTRLTAVAGETDLLKRLRERLAEADAQVTALVDAPASATVTHLEQLEASLDPAMWSLARTTAAELASRRALITEQMRLITEEYETLRPNFDRLARAARKAENVRLDDSEEQRTLAAAGEGKLRANENGLRIGHYDDVAVAVRQAKTLLHEVGLATRDDTGLITVDATALDDYTSRFERKIDEAEKRDDKMSRRSELFVISGGGTELSVPYKVLLRRPSYKDIQETNLYDDVEVLAMDQMLFRETIDRISDEALVGVRSAAGIMGSATTAPGPAPDPALRRAKPVREPSCSVLLDRLDPTARLEQIGRRMYSLLIPDAMQRLIDETDEFPLTITSNNPELPWELLHDGEDFLCLKRMFARMPAGQTFPRRTRDTAPLAETRQPKVLLIHSEAGEPLPAAETEIEAIRSSLAQMQRTPDVTVLSGADVTSSRLTDELSLGNYDVIHYAGHAGFDAQRPHLSYLHLTSGEQFRAERVQRLLEGHPVVFLNACESTRAAPPLTGQPTGSTVAQAQGLGSAFVYGGAQACVGSLWPVFDDTAAQLAITFYEHLIAKRQRVGEALREARRRSHDAKQDAITWAAYALYGDPAYRLGASVITSWSAVA